MLGAFAKCSSDIHLLLREAAKSAAMRYWRQVGAASVEAAVATYSASYRRHWGAELALQAARLGFSRAAGIPGLPGPILPGWYDLRDLFYRF